MPKYQEGQHIFLTFEDYYNEEYFKGWLDLEKCREAIKVSYWDDCEAIKIRNL